MESRRHYLHRKNKEIEKKNRKEKEKRRKHRAHERLRREAEAAGKSAADIEVSSSSESELTEEERPNYLSRLTAAGSNAYKKYQEAKHKHRKKEKEKRRKLRARKREKRNASKTDNGEQNEENSDVELSSSVSEITDDEKGVIGRMLERRARANKRRHLQWLRDEKKAKKRRHELREKRREREHNYREKRRKSGEENVSDTPYEPSTDEEPGFWQKMIKSYLHQYVPSIRTQQKLESHRRQMVQDRSGLRTYLRENIDKNAFGKKTPLTEPMRLQPSRAVQHQHNDLSHASPYLQRTHEDIKSFHDNIKNYGSPQASPLNSLERTQIRKSEQQVKKDRLALLRTPPRQLGKEKLTPTKDERDDLLGQPSPSIKVGLSLDKYKVTEPPEVQHTPAYPPGFVDYQNIPAPPSKDVNSKAVNESSPGNTIGQWLQPPPKTNIEDRQRLAIRMEKLKNHRIAGAELQRLEKLHNSRLPNLATPPVLRNNPLIWNEDRKMNQYEQYIGSETDITVSTPSVAVPPRVRRKESIKPNGAELM